jgi:hypothetical protein
MLFHYIKTMRCWKVSKTLDGIVQYIVYDAMRSMTQHSQASASLATSGEADGASGNQTTGTPVERQVHRK